MSISKKNNNKQWKSIYTVGGISAILVLAGTIIDIITGFALGGDLSAIPKTAVDRFTQINENCLLGLYNLDLLNIVNSIFMIPTFYALYASHRRVNKAYAMLAMTFYLFATSIFVANNTALPMLDLSNKYAASTTSEQRYLIAAAGEAMLARGAHGSPGVFFGFILSLISELLMSFVMLKGKIFSKSNAWTGILGSALLFSYVILVTFVPKIKTMAMIFATPGGLLSLAWMIILTFRLFKLGRLKNNSIQNNVSI